MQILSVCSIVFGQIFTSAHRCLTKFICVHSRILSQKKSRLGSNRLGKAALIYWGRVIHPKKFIIHRLYKVIMLRVIIRKVRNQQALQRWGSATIASYRNASSSWPTATTTAVKWASKSPNPKKLAACLPTTSTFQTRLRFDTLQLKLLRQIIRLSFWRGCRKRSRL